MKITITAEAESDYMTEDELKDCICGVVTDFLSQTENVGITVRVETVSFPN
jgi:hypothetical protein